MKILIFYLFFSKSNYPDVIFDVESESERCLKCRLGHPDQFLLASRDYCAFALTSRYFFANWTGEVQKPEKIETIDQRRRSVFSLTRILNFF